MGSLIKESLPEFNGNYASGGIATLKVPTSGTYHAIILEYKESGALANEAAMIAAIEEIKIKIKGVTIWEPTAQQYLNWIKGHGITFNNGYLPLFFSLPWLKTLQAREASAWGMGDVNNFTIEIRVASGRVSPELRAVAIRDAATRPLGVITKLLRNNVNITKTGKTVVKGNIYDDELVEMLAFSSDINSVKLSLQDQVYFELSKDQNAAILSYENHDGAGTSGIFLINFRTDDYLNQSLPMRVGQRVNGKDVIKLADKHQIVFDMGAAVGFDTLEVRQGIAGVI
nr:hypothetical protein 9 [bacterium]